MGVSDSVPLDPAFQTIAAWPWPKVQAALKAYTDGDFDFCIDADTIADITCLSDADTNRLVKILSQSKSGLVNALTLLISIVLIGDCAQPNVDIRLEALFDLIDFSSVSNITFEESTILLMVISSAMASIVGKRDQVPSDKTLQRASGVIYEELDKVASLPLLKSEFILWATSILDELPTNKLDSIFSLVFVKGVGITGNNATKKHAADSEEPDLPHYRKEEQENDVFKGDVATKVVPVHGTLLIKSVSLSKIEGNDVYVTLRVGDGSEWAQVTDIAPNGGAADTEWKFNGNEMVGDVDAACLEKNVINVTVKDSNDCSADKHKGKAQLNTEELLQDTNKNKFLTLSGTLQAHDGSGFAGEYTVRVKYMVPQEEGMGEEAEVAVSDDDSLYDV